MVFLTRCFTSESSIFNPKYRYQFLAALSVHILTFSHGIGLGWLSPAVNLLQSPESPLIFDVSVSEASWIGGLYGFGSLTGNLVFAFLLNRIGRTWCLKLMALPHMTMWIMIYFAKSVGFLYAARFLGGVTGGGNYILGPIFVSEIANSSIRGGLSSMAMLFTYVGILMGFVLGSYLSYFLTPCVVIALPVLYLICVFMLNDTPQYYLKKGQLKAAESAYSFYHSLNSNVLTPTETQKKWDDFDEMKKFSLKGSKDSTSVTLKDFMNKRAMLAMTTSFVVVALNQFSGMFAFISYMSLIFNASGSTMDSNLSTVITGVVQIVGTFLATIMVDRFGRRILMLVSTAGIAVGLIVFGLYVQLASPATMAQLDWLPLVLMIFVLLMGSVGVTALLFVVIVEILPAKIRAIGTSICMGFLSFLVFVSLKIFPLMLNDLGISTTFYACAAVCILTFIYLSIFLPETKGKSMDFD